VRLSTAPFLVARISRHDANFLTAAAGNVLISSTDGAVKLIDFGLALVGNASTLTVSSAVAGTPVYLAPEVSVFDTFNSLGP
jgi:serine/threonine protein kinase